MNFIKHFQGWITRVDSDDRLTPHHVSLYLALFCYWNASRFRNPITIYRHEIMAISKVGSVNTYTKALRELTEWNYIRYEPSFNRMVGSKVHLLRFDKGGEQGSGKGIRKGHRKASGNATDHGDATYTTNNPNSLNITNTLNDLNAHEPIDKNSDVGDDGNADAQREANHSAGPGGAKRKAKGQASGGRGGQAGREAVPGSLEKVQAYFGEVNGPATEAERFFNYFESNGWKVGGKTPMKDWRAAARNWILNSKNYGYDHANQPKPGRFSTGPKNYAEPL